MCEQKKFPLIVLLGTMNPHVLRDLGTLDSLTYHGYQNTFYPCEALLSWWSYTFHRKFLWALLTKDDYPLNHYTCIPAKIIKPLYILQTNKYMQAASVMTFTCDFTYFLASVLTVVSKKLAYIVHIVHRSPWLLMTLYELKNINKCIFRVIYLNYRRQGQDQPIKTVLIFILTQFPSLMSQYSRFQHYTNCDKL